jgi:hypothetical protein
MELKFVNVVSVAMIDKENINNMQIVDTQDNQLIEENVSITYSIKTDLTGKYYERRLKRLFDNIEFEQMKENFLKVINHILYNNVI